MATFYTDEKNAQIVVSLLKEHNIRKVIASPGSTNMALVVSMQHDPHFEVYSAVDERSAAYMACGLAAETGEPVVISCTGAGTASRNYLPGLTEAYYRKLPVLAITSTQPVSRVGHLVAQIVDRNSKPNDAVKLSVALPLIKDEDDLWDCEVKVNRAILELKRHGGGPVHINLPTTYSGQFNTTHLPTCRKIERISGSNSFPNLPKGSIAVFVGSHNLWSTEDTEALDQFCEANDAFVICDHTSNYKGKYRVLYSLIGAQKSKQNKFTPDLLIHIGEVTGDYYSLTVSGREVWRVSEDGEIRDTFRKLRYVFEMPERLFFSHYAKETTYQKDGSLQQRKSRLHELREELPEVPFSNIWIASKIAHRIPAGSVVHFGILNSLRSWNFFELPESVTSASNVGGFGIDGGLSTLIGASLANKSKLYFCVIGDLAFFYDMNALGNRHVGSNVRILLVNNGKGTEFTQYAHPASHLGAAADDFVSGAGHFGSQSRSLVKHYAEDLGFEYLSASNKEEFEKSADRFLQSDIGDRPIVFEVFTNSQEESKALELLMNIESDVKDKAKDVAKRILGRRTTSLIKNILR